MDKAYSIMKMEAFMKVTGSKTKCMEKEPQHGLMEEVMRESIIINNI